MEWADVEAQRVGLFVIVKLRTTYLQGGSPEEAKKAITAILKTALEKAWREGFVHAKRGTDFV